MDFFNKIGKTATSAYKVTADKTGKIAKEIKLKVKVDTLKSNVTKLYTKIGETVCNNPESEEIKKYVEEIGQLQKEIEDISEEIIKLKDSKKCKNCQSIIDKDDDFCPKCGNRQQEIIETEIVKDEEVD